MKVNSGNSILVESINSVMGTTNYKYLNGENRKVNESHVRRLIRSFVEFGSARATVTVLKTRAFSGRVEYYIADGQHTLIACNRLGLSFKVDVIELLEDTALNVTKYIATLNSNAKAWSNNNYLTSYAKNNVKEYKILSDIMSTSGLKITDLLHIFLGGGSSKEVTIFKSGKFSFINEEDSLELLNAVLMVKEMIPNKAPVRRSLYKIMRQAKDYNRMAKAIVKTAKALEVAQVKFSESEGEFYDHLVKIYKKEFGVK
jgi:hypothetical protein